MTKETMSRHWMLLVALLVMRSDNVDAFLGLPSSFVSRIVVDDTHITTRPASTQDPEMLKQEIKALQKTAHEKMDNLLLQFEDLKQFQKTAKQQQKRQSPLSPTTSAASSTELVDTTTATTTTTTPIDKNNNNKQQQTKQRTGTDTIPAKQQDDTTAPLQLLDDIDHLELPVLVSSHENKLAGTDWRVVLNVGREPGTWMDKDWGESGQRLYAQLTLHFSDTAVPSDSDEFFQGQVELYELHVTNSFLRPHGVGEQSVGQRSFPVAAKGVYKVCHNQGPNNTDLLRFCIELTEPIVRGDLGLEPGRLYGTTSYYDLDTIHDHKLRDQLHDLYYQKLRDYETLQATLDEAEDVLNWDFWKTLQKSLAAKRAMEKVHEKLIIVQQRVPEKLHLRCSNGVGLAKEGGICSKHHTKFAMEYHILGRMEVACLHDDHTDIFKDFKEL